MRADPIRSDPRRGGAVRRYHTWPTIQSQTVAEHSWNVARILTTIWPEAPVGAVRHAIEHDIGEVATGDAPYPVKSENPLLRAEMDRLESAARSHMGLSPNLMDADEAAHWRVRVKMCDVLEMWEFGWDEVQLGSRFANPIVERMLDLIVELATEYRLDPSEHQRVREYMKCRMERV